MNWVSLAPLFKSVNKVFTGRSGNLNTERFFSESINLASNCPSRAIFVVPSVSSRTLSPASTEFASVPSRSILPASLTDKRTQSAVKSSPESLSSINNDLTSLISCFVIASISSVAAIVRSVLAASSNIVSVSVELDTRSFSPETKLPTTFVKVILSLVELLVLRLNVKPVAPDVLPVIFTPLTPFNDVLPNPLRLRNVNILTSKRNTL